MSIGYYQLETGRVAAIEADCHFPPLNQALTEPNGLIAIGGDLSTSRLLNAYSHGIFPWFNAGEPIMWWSPNPRMVLVPNQLKISNSLNKTLKKQPFEIHFNTAFREVITACSQSKRTSQDLTNQTVTSESNTWITKDIIEAYCELHQKGHAICMESWLDNELVGACYGIKIGRMFFGESMFHTKTDASKVAFVNMVRYLQTQEVGLIDCQMNTPLLASFGAKEIAREEFLHQMLKLVKFDHDIT